MQSNDSGKRPSNTEPEVSSTKHAKIDKVIIKSYNHLL